MFTIRLISTLSIFSILIYFIIHSHNNSMRTLFDEERFHNTWLSMQKEYIKLSQELDLDGFTKLEKNYYHPYWEDAKNSVKQLILGPCNRDFLNLSILVGSMVVNGWTKKQEFEVAFLKNYPSKRVADLLAGFHEPEIGPHKKECLTFNCSANALHLLCYAAKILDLHKSPEILMEFGGGYGCLANIFKQVLPNCTLLLIDIPEFLAIQYLYLKYAFPQTTIIFHSKVDKEFQRGAIHLIPVHLLKDLQINVDIFVSTFAITESPMVVQNMVCDKKFFNARVLYIAGQLNGWSHMFEDHSMLCSAVKSMYSSSICMPFYYTLDSNFESYELIAVKHL